LHIPQIIKPGKKYPLVVHLHGVGEAGKDNTFSLAHLHSVLPLMLGEKQQDFFLLVLQCPPDNRIWTFKPEKDGNLDVVVALTDYVIANNPIDENRLSLFGLSSGGYGAWRWLLKYPDKFAAAVPTSCGSPDDSQKLASLKETSIWTFRNKSDGNAPVEPIRGTMQVINDSGGFMKLTQFDQGGHAAWRPAMDEYNCFSWMIAQKRGGWFNPPPERKIYTYRSLSNCFFAFFLPLLFAAGLKIFQRTKYCERLHEQIAKKFYPRRSDEAEDDKDDDDVTKYFYTWTNITGTQKLKFKLIDVKNGIARLEKLDGTICTEKIVHFCVEDQKILKQYNVQTPANQNQFRIWTDRTGTKKVAAKFIRVQDNNLLFQLKTGKIVTTNIDNFSEADQKLIREFQKQKTST
jgi:predicted esterase